MARGGTTLPSHGGAAEATSARRAVFYPKADAPVLTAGREFSSGLVERAAAAAGLKASHVVKLAAQGTFHAVYGFEAGGKPWVAKLRLTDDGKASVDVERRVSEVLAAAGIVHPRVVYADSSLNDVPCAFMVMERARGVSLRDLDDRDDLVGPTLAAQGEALASVHGVAASGFGLIASQREGVLVGSHPSWASYLGEQLDAHLETLVRSAQIDASEERLAREALLTLPEGEASVLLHGDCGPHNGFFTDGRVEWIDWEDALVGDPGFDIAMWCTFSPERRWADFFSGYFGGSPKLGDRFWLYFLRIAIAKTVVRQRLGILDKPGRPPASARIQRALKELNLAG